jgi:TatD DNase family protein
MIDLHCHLDLYPQPQEVVLECTKQKMFVLSVTTTPSAWQGTSALAENAEQIRTALGLHPQLAGQRKHELPLFDQFLPHTKYVGEVGLDGGDEFKASWADQLRVFTYVLRRCAHGGGRIISIHSRHATTPGLDRLEHEPSCGIPILHWYSGTYKELDRAITRGCWFSVGPAMLLSKKGSEIAARLPRDRVLTETDGPFAQVRGQALKPWDVSLAVDRLSDIWDTPVAATVDRLLSNLHALVTSLP